MGRKRRARLRTVKEKSQKPDAGRHGIETRQKRGVKGRFLQSKKNTSGGKESAGL